MYVSNSLKEPNVIYMGDYQLECLIEHDENMIVLCVRFSGVERSRTNVFKWIR